MKKLIALVLSGCLTAAFTSSAYDLKQSKLTQVVNDVQIISAADQTKKNASVNDLFNIPDILRTGPSSRAELVAADETVTRVGANTIFSFDPASRTIDLKQGSLLFHSPHGKGGGTIHTGSATASVLGTTFIVTTTTNGGMKVLDLEGSVQVNFTNKLKQKLDPGQMTFILPGADQLAPVIIFRLDELTRISLLVHGFSQPLPSLPLINNQVIKQDKLIKSGRATDTGLIVGENANPDQVEVLDSTTIQSSAGPANLSTALGADATISQPSLTDGSVPTPPVHIFPNQTFNVPNSAFFGSRQFNGFAARNLSINPAGGLLTVDMSPFASVAEFDLVAANNLSIGGTIVFGGFSPQSSVYFSLIAGNQIVLAPGASVTANIGNFELSSGSAFTLSGSHVQNAVGNTRFTSGANLTVKNNSLLSSLANASFSSAGNFSLAHSTIGADSTTITPVGGTLLLDSGTLNVNRYAILSAKGEVNLDSSTINANPIIGLVAVTSSSGSVNLTGTAIRTHFLTVNSGDGILLNGSGGALTTSGSGATANFTAPNLITVNHADFSSFSELNMVANTIVLSDVALAGSDSFTSANHALAANPNTSRPTVYGDVNFHNNVTYGGVLVTAPAGFVNGTIPGTGIIIK